MWLGTLSKSTDRRLRIGLGEVIHLSPEPSHSCWRQVLPVLRNLSCVKGIEWPERVLAYMQKTCRQAGITTYEEHAC